MKNPLAIISLLAAPLLSFTGVAEAAPVVYDFTATDFISGFGGSIPFTTITGDFTLDGTNITQINLTIGSHTYTPADVIYDGSTATLGGSLNGAQITVANTDDFMLATSANESNFHFGYTVAGVYDVFYSLNGSVTPTVPVPATVWLFGSSLLGLAGVARKRKAA